MNKDEAQCLTNEYCSDCGLDGKCKACDSSYTLKDGICYYTTIDKCLSGLAEKFCIKCPACYYLLILYKKYINILIYNLVMLLNIAAAPNTCEEKCPDTTYKSRDKCWPGI